MAKFYGPVGYADTVETAPGVHEEKITERMYSGDLIRNTGLIQSAETLNDNINVANEISIVADPFAYQNFYRMRYVGFMGTKWKVTKVEVRYPSWFLHLAVALQLVFAGAGPLHQGTASRGLLCPLHG